MSSNNEEKKRVIHWNKRLEEYFSSTGEKAHCLSWLHKRSEAMYSIVTMFIDLPVIIISGIVGAVSIGSDSLFGNSSNAPVILGALSIFVGILNTIGTYFSWSKKCEAHRVSSIQYSRLYRHLNVEMSLPRVERATPDELLKYVRNEYERLSEISPLIPMNIISKFNKIFKNTDTISKPEEVNGLEKITIYEGGIEDSTLPPPEPEATPESEPEVKKSEPEPETEIDADFEKEFELSEISGVVVEPVLPDLKVIDKRGNKNTKWK